MSERAHSPCMITVCRGVEPAPGTSGCRFATPVVEGIVQRIEGVVAASGWNDFLREQVRGPLMQHHAFKVALSACPNGCSRPHVADVGIIRAVQPGPASAECTQCGLCERQCPDEALRMGSHGPVLDTDRCLACGLCVRRCPEKALPVAADGWRVLLGGKLGRRPRLATQVGGILDEATVLHVLHGALTWYMRDYAPKRRFGVLVAASLDGGAFLLERP